MGEGFDFSEEEGFLDDEDVKDEEWISHLAMQQWEGKKSQLIRLMEKLDVYDEEQLRLALRNARKSVVVVCTLEVEFPKPVRLVHLCPSSTSLVAAGLLPPMSANLMEFSPSLSNAAILSSEPLAAGNPSSESFGASSFHFESYSYSQSVV